MPKFHFKHAFLGAVFLLLLTALGAFAAGEDQFYKLGPDSPPQDGVPKGVHGMCRVN